MSDTKKTRMGIVLILLFLVGSLYWISSGKPDTYPPYLSESPSPTGVKAFYTLQEEREQDTARWSTTPDRLSTGGPSR